MLEISAAGVTKATTLAVLCEDLGVEAEEVIAFGDMPNDIAMLTWAGTSYAMADAHPTVIEAATHLAPEQRRRRRGAGAGLGVRARRRPLWSNRAMLRRLLVLVVVALTTVVVSDASAHAACRCKDLSLPQQVNNAGAVFSGTADHGVRADDVGRPADDVVRRRRSTASTRATSPRRA